VLLVPELFEDCGSGDKGPVTVKISNLHNALDSVLDREFVSVFRGWHTLERNLKSGIEPIDIDLADPAIHAFEYRSRQAVLDSVEHLISRLPPTEPVLVAHAHAAAEVVGNLDRGGRCESVRDYVRATVQVPIWKIPDEQIERSRNNVVRALHELSEGASLQNLPIDPDPSASIRAALQEGKQLWNQLLELFNVSAHDPPFRLQVDRSPAYWKSWINGSLADGLVIRFNETPRRPYYVGDALSLVLHEIIGHAFQMTLRTGLIRSGVLCNAHGITGVFGPEQFAFEGLAQTVPDWAEALKLLAPSNSLRFARVYEQLRVFTYHNANCLLMDGAPPDHVGDFVSGILPGEPPEAIRRELDDRMQHPLLRAYLFVYGLSDLMFSDAIKETPPDQLMTSVYRWYAKPITAADWIALYSGSAAKRYA
jgi:hypothetical protein